MNKQDVIDWISGHYGQSGDQLLQTIELLEIEEACADRRAQMYSGAHEAALSYKSSMVNYGGRLIKVMPETVVNDYSRIPQYIDAMKTVEQVKRASQESAKLVSMGGVLTDSMVPPPVKKVRKGWVTLMREGAVRLTSRRKKGAWKKGR